MPRPTLITLVVDIKHHYLGYGGKLTLSRVNTHTLAHTFMAQITLSLQLILTGDSSYLPNLDVHGDFSIKEDLDIGILSINAGFVGDVFPSTEAFIVDQSGKTKVFLGARKETGGIGDLYGDNKKSLFKVNMNILFDKDGNFTGVRQDDKDYTVDEWNQKIKDEWDKN
jgi:hypothetical protein